MSPSAHAYALVRAFEGCRLEAYADSGGVWTIGWGHTPALAGEVITQRQADTHLQGDVASAAWSVAHLLKVSVSQPEFDALTVFTYNIGAKQLAESTLLKRLNSGDHLAAAREFTRWCIDDGRIVRGLLIRRLKEALLFLDAPA